MKPDEVFFESVIESLRSLECEWQNKAEICEAKSDAQDRVDAHELEAAARVYRECAQHISNRLSRFPGLYERLQAEPQQGPFQFGHELTQLLNRHSAENASNTPDFILAEFMLTCLNAWNTAAQAREKWYGRQPVPADPPPDPVPWVPIVPPRKPFIPPPDRLDNTDEPE